MAEILVILCTTNSTLACFLVFNSFEAEIKTAALRMNTSDVIVEGWERSETIASVPYYINHKSERTCWDHPYYVKIMDELGEMDGVKYAAYRTALKLRHLQKRFKLHQLNLHTVSTVFIQYGYQDGIDTTITCEELTMLLSEMYTHCDLQRLSQADINIQAELLLNLLLNIHDTNRSGCIRVICVKVALACLCTSRLSEKYKYFHRQLCDPNFFITRKTLGTFLSDCLQIPELINEKAAFGGSNITPAVDSCIHLSGQGPGVSEDSFLSWLFKEPQTLVWLPTMHRVTVSESVKHDSRCNVCKACPIVGFRYRCLQCFNFDICQNCFFSGRTGKGHKLKHPTIEYCLPTSSKDDTKAFMKTIRNNLSKKHRMKNKPKYLPIDGGEYYGADEWTNPESIPSNMNPVILKKANTLPSKSPAANPSRVALSPIGQFQVRSANQKVTAKSHGLRKVSNVDKENLIPYKRLSIPEEDRLNLEAMIRSLEAENRALYKQLSEMKGGERSETESNGSYMEELEEEREVLEAKKEVLEHHNMSLNKQLSRVRHALKTSPSSGFGDSDISVDVTPFTDDYSTFFSPSLPVVSPLPNYSLASFQNSQDTSLEEGSPVTIGDLQTPGNDNSPIRNDSVDIFHSFSPADHAPRNATLNGDSFERMPTHFFSPYRVESESRKQPDSEQRVPNGFTPQFTTPSGWDSVDLIEGDLGQSNFTLPYVSQSQNFPDEEAELDSLVQRIEKAFPSDMSYSIHMGRSRSYGVDADMLCAANRVGEAMSEFVSATANQSSGSSLY